MTMHHRPPRPWSPGRGRRLLIAAAGALALAAVAVPAGTATAAAATQQTRYVATTGSDTRGGADNDCTAQATPCLTIKHALAEAADGDTISLGAGTFAGGTGASPGDLVVTASVTIVGDPTGSTIACTATPANCANTSASVIDVNGGSLTLRDVTVFGNGSSTAGVQVESGSATLLDSTVTDNGFGVVVQSNNNNLPAATVTITGSTIAGNLTDGIQVGEDGTTMTITGSTIAENGTSGLAGRFGITTGNTTNDAITMAGTLLVNNGNNSDSAQCNASSMGTSQVTDLGHNLSSASGPGSTPCFTDPTSQYDPTLTLPAQPTPNGGPTPTLVPAAGSTAIDAIPADNTLCTGTDQRGISRPQGAGCDIGAVERSIAPVIGTVSLPNANVGAAYSQTLAASDGTAPYTWALTSGALPAGLTLDPSTGTISGAATTGGTSDFTVTVTDSASGTVSADLSITSVVPAPLAVTTTSLPDGGTGTVYLQTLAATGGVAPYTWAVTSGSLPAGLTLNKTTGTISGTPSGTSAGTAKFTVTTTDSSLTPNTASADLSLTIAYNGPSQPLNLTATGQNGQVVLNWDPPASFGSKTFATYAVYRSTTPGVDTSGTPVAPVVAGTLTWTDNTVTDGTKYFYVVVANNPGGKSPASNEVSATPAALSVGTSSLPGATIGSAYSQTLKATGGTAPYTWAVTSGALPDGLSLDAGSGRITGTPTTVGTSSFTVTATDSAATPATASAGLSIKVAAAASTTRLTMSPALAAIGARRTITATVTRAGGTPTGTVTFKTGTTTGRVSLRGGKAVWVLPRLLAVGSHKVTASYAGNTTTRSSTANAVTVIVTKARPGARAAVKMSGRTKTVDKTVKITITVTAPSGVTRQGGVSVRLSGKSRKTVRATVNSRGVATVTIRNLKRGSYKASIAYAGNKEVFAKTITKRFKA